MATLPPLQTSTILAEPGQFGEALRILARILRACAKQATASVLRDPSAEEFTVVTTPIPVAVSNPDPSKFTKRSITLPERGQRLRQSFPGNHIPRVQFHRMLNAATALENSLCCKNQTQVGPTIRIARQQLQCALGRGCCVRRKSPAAFLSNADCRSRPSHRPLLSAASQIQSALLIPGGCVADDSAQPTGTGRDPSESRD